MDGGKTQGERAGGAASGGRPCKHTRLAGPSEMGSWLLGALPATLALVVLTHVGDGAELRDAAWEAEGDPRKASFWLSRTAQRNKPTFYRTGSLSALSRGLMANLSVSQEAEEGDTQQRKREASPALDACRGCCVTQFPNHTGSIREPARGDSGHVGSSTPPPKPPKRNTTTVHHRPGTYTPMGKMRRGWRPLVESKQDESSPGIKGYGRPEANATERCRGCCGAAGRPLARGEEGKGSHNSQGSSGQRPWRPVLATEVPAHRPSQKGGSGQPSFSKGAHEPRPPPPGQ